MDHRSQRGLSPLCLIVLSLALLGCTAAAAQAETIKKPGVYLFNNGTPFTKSETVKGGLEGTGIFSIPAKSTEIRCTKGVETEGVIENREGSVGVGTGKFTFSGCTVFNSKTKEELAACTKELNNHNANGELAAHGEKLTFLEKTSEYHTLILVSHPPPGEAFITIEFGGTCALPEKVEVKGSFAVEIPSEDAVKLTISVDTGSAAGKELQERAEAKLSFGSSEAFLQAKDFVELSGIHAGAPWGVM
jgi:hypothetical protein